MPYSEIWCEDESTLDAALELLYTAGYQSRYERSWRAHCIENMPLSLTWHSDNMRINWNSSPGPHEVWPLGRSIAVTSIDEMHSALGIVPDPDLPHGARLVSDGVLICGKLLTPDMIEMLHRKVCE